ncbi:FxsA family protein [Mycolicibacterium hodleri]|uniref:Membrane protein FxsA n=1 Tax=Mycolicibacterium hodleri TaxID=49897 RepID=A0A502EAQ3_9MYCO|nr:FxsA family protein [Mycolicibacterium hodleri]TPG33511.1 membrane protein FxsA [Mycolicibacterium hodleri]
MAMRLFLIYVLVELAVVVALVSTIGFGWTLLVVIGTFALGLVLAGSQMRRQIQQLRVGLAAPRGAVPDGALVALGTVLTVVPGLVTSALGLLLLLPPTRAAARPVVTALAARGLGRVPLIVTTAGNMHQPHRGEYIDGEVVDVTDVEQPRLPKHPDVA